MVGRILWLIFLSWCALVQAQPQPREVRYFQVDSRYAYRTQLLQLILDKTREQGEFILRPTYTQVTQDRGIQLLIARKIDVVSLPTTVEREHELLPVKMDIMQGLLGYRLLLIRRQQQAAFSQIQTLEQLRHFSAGFGSQWADLPILQSNGLRVVPSPQYEHLFAMLEKGRFDFFPRGLNEAFREQAERQLTQPDLAVESDLALYYPYPVYFFVHRQDEALAQRLRQGLQRAQLDGSMFKLFMHYHGEDLAKANLPRRRLFQLRNPLLPEGTPTPDTHRWLHELERSR
jgi:hypothetical protein